MKIHCVITALVLFTGLLSACAPPDAAKTGGVMDDYQTDEPRAGPDNPADNAQTAQPSAGQAVWTFAAPESQGVNGTLLQKFYDKILEEQIQAVVIARNGSIVWEYYKSGYNESSAFQVFSCTKSVVSALIGMAIDEGYIGGVDVRISEYFPQLEAQEEDKKEITIAHLLTQASGIEWDEGAIFGAWEYSGNWVDFVLALPIAAKPGSTFNYNTGATHLLSAVFHQATGQTPDAFAREKLFGPLGIDSVIWNTDPQGISGGGMGISMTARDMAKFGQLYLNKGAWGGRQIVSEAWVNASTAKQAPGDAEYGYLWWTPVFDGDKQGFQASGFGGQNIFVAPEANVVMAVISWYPTQDSLFIRTYFEDYVLKACEDNG